MPELKNCRRCNRIFTYITGAPLCEPCKKEDEKIFEEVNLYVRDHQGVPLTVVSKELDISYEKLMKYVREGRLQFRAPNGELISFCEKCGNEIRPGRFCPECEKGINTVLHSTRLDLMDKIAQDEKDKGGYHFHTEHKKAKE